MQRTHDMGGMQAGEIGTGSSTVSAINRHFGTAVFASCIPMVSQERGTGNLFHFVF
jgi:hypothetical protein